MSSLGLVVGAYRIGRERTWRWVETRILEWGWQLLVDGHSAPHRARQMMEYTYGLILNTPQKDTLLRKLYTVPNSNKL